MKKNLFIFSAIGILTIGYFRFFKKSSEREFQTDMASHSISSKDSKTQQKNQSKDELKNELFIVASSKQKELTFKVDGAFGVANPPVPREEILAQFARGTVVDGIVIKANYKDLRKNYESGQVFEVPMVDGSSIRVVPKKVFVNLDRTTIFVGESERHNKEPSPNSIANNILNEVNFVFFDERLIMGKLTSNRQAYQIVNGQHGSYLLEISPDAKID